MPTQVVRRGPVTDPATAGINTFGSFLGGYLAQKRWRTEQAERGARTKVLERQVGVRESELEFRKEEQDRIHRRERATQKAVVGLLGYLGTAAKDPKARRDWRANVASQLFEYSKDPDVDLGALSTFGQTAADWLIPKDEIEPKIWEEFDEATGNTVAWIIDLNTGKKLQRLGVVDSKGYIAGTGMTGKDLYDIYTDLRDRYADAYSDFYKNQIDAGKYLLGTPFLITDDTLDPEKRMQKGVELFSKMRSDAEVEIGSFRQFATPHLMILFKDQKKVNALLDSLGHVETPKPQLTPERIESVFRGVIGQMGWSGDTYVQLKAMIEELESPTEKAYAHQALSKVMGELPELRPPTPNPATNPWYEMTAPEGISLGLNPPMTIASDATPKLKDFPAMLASDFDRLFGNIPLMEIDPHVLWSTPADRVMSRQAIPRRKPTQMYFDIRDELRNMAPDLFGAGSE